MPELHELKTVAAVNDFIDDFFRNYPPGSREKIEKDAWAAIEEGPWGDVARRENPLLDALCKALGRRAELTDVNASRQVAHV